ncbi:MAG: hypothetical protein AAGA58_09195, partial [Verrucomicrobiota bacterium]
SEYFFMNSLAEPEYYLDDLPSEFQKIKQRYTDVRRVSLKTTIPTKGTIRIDNKVGEVPILVRVWKNPIEGAEPSIPEIQRTVFPGDFFERTEIEGSMVLIEAENSQKTPRYSYYIGFAAVRVSNESFLFTTEGETRVTWQIRNHYPDASGDVHYQFTSDGREISNNSVPHPIWIHCFGLGKKTTSSIERKENGEGKFSAHIGLTPKD